MSGELHINRLARVISGDPTVDGNGRWTALDAVRVANAYLALEEQLKALHWSAQYVADMHPEDERLVDHKSMRRLRAALALSPAKEPN